VNPSLGWEYRRLGATPALKKRKAMIVGAGPGGMAAAQYLAERGHEVVLYEKAGKLGGRMPEASALCFKEGFRRYFDYTVRKTIESGAIIVLGTEVNADTIKLESPDLLILAVGAKQIVPAIKGIDSANVTDVVSVDRGDVVTGNKVVVCGAGMSGTECAIGLAMEGKEVILVDMLPLDMFYNDVPFFSKPTIDRLLSEYKVKLIPECTVQEFTGDGVTVKNAAGKSIRIKCDTAVIAFGVTPDENLIAELSQVVPETYIIGDAHKVGQIGDAIGSAFWLAKDL